MDMATYAAEAEVEADHWWFVGRRRLFARELARLGVARHDHILDVGTSTGTNLRMLRDGGYADFVGLDPSPVAARFCAEKGLGRVESGDICALPFGDHTFATVLATDVIEHVDDDLQALREVRRVLRPGGHALVTVPAFPSLWGLQDEVAHHKRRYRMAPLTALMSAAGLEVTRAYHFNYLLFVPIFLARQSIRRLRIEADSENQLNTPALNALLRAIFDLDVRSAPALKPPFGVSILAIGRRPRT